MNTKPRRARSTTCTIPAPEIQAAWPIAATTQAWKSAGAFLLPKPADSFAEGMDCAVRTKSASSFLPPGSNAYISSHHTERLLEKEMHPTACSKNTSVYRHSLLITQVRALFNMSTQAIQTALQYSCEHCTFSFLARTLLEAFFCNTQGECKDHHLGR